MTTCQICGRQIKAARGLIAHHGYMRPHLGWQTSSCFGAQYQPYEKSCAALGPCISLTRKHLESRQTMLRVLTDTPPETLTITHDRGGRLLAQFITLTRPTDFVSGSKWPPKSNYEREHQKRSMNLEREIRGYQETLKYLEDRLAKWRGE